MERTRDGQTIEDLIQSSWPQSVLAELAWSATTGGMFVRTLIPSPQLKWIIPGRIRHRGLNDVLVIGRNFIQIRQVASDREMRIVGAHCGFRSSIISAGLVGMAEELDRAVETQVHFSDDGRPAGVDDHDIPPQILVLGLEHGTLAFVMANGEPMDGVLRFHISYLKFFTSGASVYMPGSHMTTDPTSQYLALGAHMDTVAIWRLKPRDQIAKEFAANKRSWMPVRPGEAYLPVNGNGTDGSRIMHLTFMNPGDSCSALLVALYRKDNHTRLWKCKIDADDAMPGGFRTTVTIMKLPSDMKPCSLVIPYRSSPRLLLCGSDTFYKLENILDGPPIEVTPLQVEVVVPEYKQTLLRHTRSILHPVFTAYTTAPRAWEYLSQGKESFYLIREDGLVIAIGSASVNDNLVFCITGFTSTLHATAVASPRIATPLQDPDYLAVTALLGDGEVMRIGWHGSFERMLKLLRRDAMDPVTVLGLPNWAPTSDMVVKTAPGKRPSIYMASGMQPDVAVVEMQTGCEAVVNKVSVMERDVGDAVGVWCAPHGTGEERNYFVGYPHATMVMAVGVKDRERRVDGWEGVTFDVVPHDGVLIDVGKEALRLRDNMQYEIMLEREYAGERNAMMAARTPNGAGVVVTFGGRSRHSMLVYSVTVAEDTRCDIDFGDHLELDFTPTCITALSNNFGLGAFVLVGSTDGIVRVFKVEEFEFVQVGQHAIGDAPSSPSGIVESIMVLDTPGPQSSTDPAHYLVVCGMRGGDLCSVQLTLLPETQLEVEIGNLRNVRVGLRNVPVTLYGSLSSTDAVGFAVCDSELFRLSVDLAGRLVITQVFFTDNLRPNYRKPRNPVIYVDNTVRNIMELQSSVLVASEGWVLNATIYGGKLCLPRRIPLLMPNRSNTDNKPMKLEQSGTPRLLLDLSGTECIAVGAVRTEEQKPKKRYCRVRGFVHLVNVVEQPAEFDFECDRLFKPWYPAEQVLITLDEAEWATCMADWRMGMFDGREKRMLVIGTSKVAKKRDKTYKIGREIGRLVFVALKTEGEKIVTAKVTNIKTREHVVQCVAVYDERRIVVADDNEVSVYGLSSGDDVRAPSFTLYARLKLPGGVQSLDVQAPRISIAMTHMSVLGCRYLEEPPVETGTALPHSIVREFGDIGVRKISSHVMLDYPGEDAEECAPAILMSDMDGKLSVLRQPRDKAPLKQMPRGRQAPNYARVAVPRLDGRGVPGDIVHEWDMQVPFVKIINLQRLPETFRRPWLGSGGAKAQEPVDLICAALDGSITTVRIYPSAQILLLGFLQNLVKYARQAEQVRAGEISKYTRPVVVDPICETALFMTDGGKAMPEEESGSSPQVIGCGSVSAVAESLASGLERPRESSTDGEASSAYGRHERGSSSITPPPMASSSPTSMAWEHGAFKEDQSLRMASSPPRFGMASNGAIMRLRRIGVVIEEYIAPLVVGRDATRRLVSLVCQPSWEAEVFRSDQGATLSVEQREWHYVASKANNHLTYRVGRFVDLVNNALGRDPDDMEVAEISGAMVENAARRCIEWLTYDALIDMQ